MSAKWRALQHRHRYTYSAIIFPDHFKQTLTTTINHHHDDPSARAFYALLSELISLNSTYSQLTLAKKFASAFTHLLQNHTDDPSVVLRASRFYLQILFFENSVPIHRTLVSVLSKARDLHDLIRDCFRSLCEEYSNSENVESTKSKRFCVSRVGLSMMGTPKLGYLVEVVEECAVLMGLDVVSGLNSVVYETNDGSRPSPIVMEQCQDALSCLYYLLQRCPLKFDNFDVMEMILKTVLSVLKSEAFSRDCFVAAGVAFCAALQACLVPQELGFVVMEGMFCRDLSYISSTRFKELVMKVPYQGDLFMEINEFPLLSRLCLIRGILTSVPRTILDTPFDVCGCDESVVLTKTILYDGILPELCGYCENPVDSHFNFHALTVMQICLQQIKTLMQTRGNDGSENYDPISDDISGRILRIIWNNLEDPLSQTVKQVHLIFDIFLDIHSSTSSTDGKERIQLFLRKIASNLLRMGARCKGRYVPLASLTKRLGAKTILEMSPDLMFEIAWAYIDDDVCCAATTFLKCFLECLLDEFWSSDGVENGYTNYRNACLPPFLHGLALGKSKLRSNLNTYAFPVILGVDVDSIFPMLAFISIGPVGENTFVSFPDVYGTNMNLRVEQKVAVLVSLLKVSRSLALIEGDVDRFESGDYALLCVKGIKVKVLVNWLVLALTHVDESLRTDAVESLFLNPKTASLPSSLELSMMKEAIPLNMRCSSTSFQMKLTSLFRKFFSRVRTALERQIKQGNWRPSVVNNGELEGTDDDSYKRAEALFLFMKWLSSFLFFSCYPSAPYERKIMATEIILIMNNTWPIVQDSASEIALMTPYDPGFISPEATLLLVGSIVDSWDRLRENSFRILLHFPTPLPGIMTTGMVQEVIIWAKKLVCSPRVRESDAGALTMRLIFRKYVLDLGWVVKTSCNLVSFHSQKSILGNGHDIHFSPVIKYVISLIDWLRSAVEMGEKDLSDACKDSFVHGVLLTLRYTFEELDWESNIVLSNISGMKHALEKLLELVMRITSMALSVVSADAWHLPDNMEDLVNDDSYTWEVSGDVNIPIPVLEKETTDTESVQDVGPVNQVIMVGCWLAMKEVSLLLGTIIRKVPLPTSDISDPQGGLRMTDDVVLDFRQLETIGNHFLEVLMKMKHNGAIDKTRAGFTALCNRLLCSDNPRLAKLTESWMEQLMERTVAKEQTVDDLLRRSAGIPAAFIAFFLSEPEGTPKRLLPRALRWLIDLANRPMMDQTETKLTTMKQETEMNDSKLNSKTRDEGVIPTVHAFNVLRAAFNDTNLATDTSGFSAEAMIIAIRSFSSSYWEVRNSACLAYTALIRRMIGFLNVQKRESARRALTGLEFFHRYPSLHPFLYSELRIATEFLTDSSPQPLGSNLAKAVHPSLCPMLILLCRLKPSPIASETGDVLDPFLFMPFIRRCSTQSNLRVRVLASRALTGLISNEKLPLILLNIVTELPSGTKLASSNMIHGLLLQLISLLDINCRNLADFSKKDQILDDLIQVLATRSWIGSPKLCSCPTLNTSFLRVLDIMLSISRTCYNSKCFSSICQLLLELSSECLDAEASFGLPYYDPTIAECRKQAAVSYFSCVFQTSKDVDKDDTVTLMSWKHNPTTLGLFMSETSNGFTNFHKRLMRSLSDVSYEVRIATLKWLLMVLKDAELDDHREDQWIKSGLIKWIKLHLHSEMVNLLSLEKNHRCTCCILKILFSWNMQNLQKLGSDICLLETRFVGNIDADSLFRFWDQLVSLYKVTRHVKTLEILLCCMGVCIKQFASMFMSQSDHMQRSSKVYDCISYYVDLVKQHADPSEPVNIRKAAAESVVASGLLQTVDFISQYVTKNFDQKDLANMYACRTLDMWSTCIKLLEDEDVILRSKLAIDVQKCFSTETYRVIPSQVDKVIISSFEHLSSIFGNWTNYFDYLSNWILSASNNVVSRGDLVRRVFDKEIDNHHEEKLLLCQICCFHLENLRISKSLAVDENGGLDLLHEWRSRFFQRLMSFADHGGKQAVDWIGGLGNHKDAFLPVYSNLLGVYALSRCIFYGKLENSSLLASEVADLKDAIKPFLGNPMIYNLFYSLIRLHEKPVSGNLAVWDGFNPYFLLR
uniref:thyroid adenoma-associated protein homolog n=1 Tax=Erigeron canadensis TaxID=72917 RepID=UPI001CB90FE2|nr:thyroid adenoma-associated protein homolog [Erigeron canadensis]